MSQPEDQDDARIGRAQRRRDGPEIRENGVQRPARPDVVGTEEYESHVRPGLRGPVL